MPLVDVFTLANLSDNISDRPLTHSQLEITMDYILGSVMSILTFVGVFANGSALYMFVNKENVRSRTSFLIRSLSVSDGIMAIVGGTMFSINCFYHRWIFKTYGCYFYATIMFWCGGTSIAHLCAISIERYVTISNLIWSMANQGKIKLYIFVMISICWFYGFIWAILPVFGVQSYVIEGRVSCSINWFSRRPLDVNYNIVIFFTTFILPFFIILFCNLRVLFMVRASSSSRLLSCSSKRYHLFKETEVKLTKTIVTTTVFYLLAWTPYAVVCMWAAFGNVETIPPLYFSCLAFTAKLSFIFNPIVYVGCNSIYRREMLNLMREKLNFNVPCFVKIIQLQTDRSDSNSNAPNSQTPIHHADDGTLETSIVKQLDVLLPSPSPSPRRRESEGLFFGEKTPLTQSEFKTYEDNGRKTAPRKYSTANFRCEVCSCQKKEIPASYGRQTSLPLPHVQKAPLSARVRKSSSADDLLSSSIYREAFTTGSVPTLTLNNNNTGKKSLHLTISKVDQPNNISMPDVSLKTHRGLFTDKFRIRSWAMSKKIQLQQQTSSV